MTIIIDNPETEKLVLQLVSITGKSEEALLEMALETSTERHTSNLVKENLSMKEKLLEIARSFNSLPILDNRTPDEIIGYDENGLPS